MRTKNILLMTLCLLSSAIIAQTELITIRLLDLETALPIEGATYEYGTQQSLTDQNGIISFSYEADTPLSLSHLNYGTWILAGQDLESAIRQQVIYRKEITVNLYPVTIIAVKPQQAQPDGVLKIEYQDYLQHDAAAILEQSPAFNSIRKGGNYGFDPVFRGFKYDQLNVVMNGAQSATAACPNRMDPPTSQMAPNMMDRIEILKGPHALRYGTGFGATINFIPAGLRFSNEPDLYGRISGGYESNGNLIRGETQLGLSGEKYDISAFAAWSQGDDYSAGNGETVQADFSRGSFGTNIGIKMSPRQQLRISALYNRARDADFPALPMDLREDDTWLFSVRHDIRFEREILHSWNTTAFGSLVDHLMNNFLKTETPQMINAETFATTYNYGGRTEGNWHFKRSKLYAGADLRIEGAEGTRIREFLMGSMAGTVLEDNAWQDGRISRAGLFTEYQIRGRSFDYVFSGRMEMNTADVNDPTEEFTLVNPDTRITQVNPSVSAGILKDLSEKIQTGFWLARAQRSGSLTERFINYFPVGQDPYEMLGNPQLAPEVNYQGDLTLMWHINENSAINIDLFGAYLQDYISSVIDTSLTPRIPMSPGVRRYINIDEAFKTGFEVSWNQYLVAGLSHRMGVAYTYGQDRERDEPLPEVAPLDIRYTLSGSYFKDRLKPEATFRFVSEQSRVSSEFGETVTPSFSLLDVKIGYQVTRGLSVNAGVTNLLDQAYYEHLNRSVRGTNDAIFAPGRNIFINIHHAF